MPQVDKATFLIQIVWLLFFFLSFYLYLIWSGIINIREAIKSRLKFYDKIVKKIVYIVVYKKDLELISSFFHGYDQEYLNELLYDDILDYLDWFRDKKLMLLEDYAIDTVRKYKNLMKFQTWES